jgi:hypothetical protein
MIRLSKAYPQLYSDLSEKIVIQLEEDDFIRIKTLEST